MTTFFESGVSRRLTTLLVETDRDPGRIKHNAPVCCRRDLCNSSAFFICGSQACMLGSRPISESDSCQMTLVCAYRASGITELKAHFLSSSQSAQVAPVSPRSSQIDVAGLFLVCFAVVLVRCRGKSLCDDSDGSGPILVQVVRKETSAGSGL